VQPRFHDSPRNAAFSNDADPLDVIAGFDRQSGLPDCACWITRWGWANDGAGCN